MFSKVSNQVKEKIVIIQSIGIVHCINKSEETRVVAYTCRYFSGKLIPIFQSVAVAELGIKGPLEYLQGVGYHHCFFTFIYMIPIACKITNFSLYLCK